jgi:hypothetical protein
MDIFYVKYINNIINMDFLKKETKMILEPFCCLIRILLILYKPDNIKISIINNSIRYVEDNGLQSIIRTINRDTREDLHNLYSPIMKSFEWFPKNEEIYSYIYKETLKGYTKFMNVYDKNSVIYHTLNHYRLLIVEFIDGNENIKQSVGESPLIDNLKNIWSKSETILVYNLIKLIELSEENSIYIEILEKLLSFKEQKVYEYITKNSQTYDS